MADDRPRYDLERMAKEKDAYFAIEPAEKEAIGSKLPGRENGPADAYRHILWAAELTPRFGEPAARLQGSGGPRDATGT